MAIIENPILAAEAERLNMRPGETWPEYRDRHHPKGCNCPTSKSMCKYGVFYRQQYGDFSTGHGGWGWTAAYGWPMPPR